MRKQNVTLMDIAKRAGVSRTTVSQVLGGTGRISEETRQAVRKAMNDLGYVYNRNAALLRGSPTKTIGLLIYHFDNPFFSEFVAGFSEQLQIEDYVALVADTNDDPTQQIKFLDRFREHNVDGIALVPATGTDESLWAKLSEWQIPTLVAIRRIGNLDLPYVGTDNAFGSNLAMEHLLRQGHERIAFLGGNTMVSTTIERLEAYRKALSNAGLEWRREVFCRPSNVGAYEAMGEIIQQPRPTAIYCYNDYVASGVLAALWEAEITPGKDIAVVSNDGTRNGRFTHPPLTTLDIQPERLGRTCAKEILKRIQKPDAECTSVWLRGDLRIRQSG